MNVLEGLQDPEARISDFIRYDTAVGREQAIDINRVSTLSNFEVMNLKPGVKLTQFAAEANRKIIMNDMSNNTTGINSSRPKTGMTRIDQLL